MKIYDYDYFYDIILNCKKQDVLNIINNKEYKTFNIPKKNGLRTIVYLEKNSILNILQRNLLKKVFFNEPIPVCAKGFVENESYRSFLAPHIGNKYFLRVDIHDFFGSIKKNTIENMLTSIVLISNIDKKSDVISMISEIITLNDCLPQGACTSPTVSNLCFVPLDQRITKYCQKLNIRYTRYADDLLFSSDNFNFYEKKWFLRTIRKILRTQNLKLNYSKIKFSKDELNINGFVVGDVCIRISRKRCSDLKRILYTINQNKSLIKTNPNDALKIINSTNLRYRNLSNNPFNDYYRIIQFINGYRSFLISWLDSWSSDESNQKELKRLINKCEKTVDMIYKSI